MQVVFNKFTNINCLLGLSDEIKIKHKFELQIDNFCFGNTEESIEIKRSLKEEINQLDVLFNY